MQRGRALPASSSRHGTCIFAKGKNAKSLDGNIPEKQEDYWYDTFIRRWSSWRLMASKENVQIPFGFGSKNIIALIARNCLSQPRHQGLSILNQTKQGAMIFHPEIPIWWEIPNLSGRNFGVFPVVTDILYSRSSQARKSEGRSDFLRWSFCVLTAGV